LVDLNGDQTKQFSESPSRRFAKGVIKAPMSRFEASTSYWTIRPSITFISCTTMTHDQLDAIQKPMINAILPKMGFEDEPQRRFHPRQL
jgi:hypothetical protein